MSLIIESLTQALRPWFHQPLVIAFSGGVDSTTLLHALVSMRKTNKQLTLSAIHVNHGLSKNALDWEKKCHHLCQCWSVELTSVKADVSDVKGVGLEQAARSARYKAFSEVLIEGDCLVQGHHLDDQAETVLLRLFRGTGVTGLAAMPRFRSLGNATIIRPFLSVSRSDIEQYASEYQLSHIEDESNHNQKFSRNYLRHSLLPAVERRWPQVSVRLAALADELAAVNEQLDTYIEALAQSVIQTRPQWLLRSQPLLDIEKIKGFKSVTQQQIIRFWLKLQRLPIPGRVLLEKIFVEVIHARVDANPLLCWPGCELRRYRGLLCASRPHPKTLPISGVYWNWLHNPHCVHQQLGDLYVKGAAELDVTCADLPNEALEVRTRECIDPSLKISIAGRVGSKSLKRWLQEFGVPPWLRDQVPFIFFQDKMIAAPNLWVCTEFVAKNNGGYQMSWDRVIDYSIDEIAT